MKVAVTPIADAGAGPSRTIARASATNGHGEAQIAELHRDGLGGNRESAEHDHYRDWVPILSTREQQNASQRSPKQRYLASGIQLYWGNSLPLRAHRTYMMPQFASDHNA